MQNPVALILFFSSAVLLAFTHVSALSFGLHYVYPWLDLGLHLLGGITVALGLAVLQAMRPRFAIFLSLYRTLLIVLFAGLSWEAFEIVIGVPYGEPGFMADTAMDLFMDVFGGGIGYLVLRRLSTM